MEVSPSIRRGRRIGQESAGTAEGESYNGCLVENALVVSTNSACEWQPAAGSDRQWRSFGRRLINYCENLLSWFRRTQIITPPSGIVKVNVGSGLYVAPGWINVDGSLKTALTRWPRSLLRLIYRFMSDPGYSREEFVELLRSNAFVLHNLKYGLPFPSESVDFIFTSHLIHHLYKDEAERLLKDAWRVLKSKGTIRIAVPNLEFIIELYLQGRREEALEKYFFYPSAPRSTMSTRHYQYDFVLLKRLLEGAGFSDVRRCHCYEGNTPDIEKLDRLIEETLFVEASK